MESLNSSRDLFMQLQKITSSTETIFTLHFYLQAYYTATLPAVLDSLHTINIDRATAWQQVKKSYVGFDGGDVGGSGVLVKKN